MNTFKLKKLKEQYFLINTLKEKSPLNIYISLKSLNRNLNFLVYYSRTLGNFNNKNYFINKKIIKIYNKIEIFKIKNLYFKIISNDDCEIFIKYEFSKNINEIKENNIHYERFIDDYCATKKYNFDKLIKERKKKRLNKTYFEKINKNMEIAKNYLSHRKKHIKSLELKHKKVKNFKILLNKKKKFTIDNKNNLKINSNLKSN